jgi:hypothetical protein
VEYNVALNAVSGIFVYSVTLGSARPTLRTGREFRCFSARAASDKETETQTERKRERESGNEGIFRVDDAWSSPRRRRAGVTLHRTWHRVEALKNRNRSVSSHRVSPRFLSRARDNFNSQ